jgi:hypothetical protein
VQRKILADHLGQIQYALKRFIDAQHLEDAASPVSAHWSPRTRGGLRN